MVDIEEQPDPLLKTSEVAKMFGVQDATIRHWIKTGLLRAVKIGQGHYWRVPTSAARELANKKYGDDNDQS